MLLIDIASYVTFTCTHHCNTITICYTFSETTVLLDATSSICHATFKNMKKTRCFEKISTYCPSLGLPGTSLTNKQVSLFRSDS